MKIGIIGSGGIVGLLVRKFSAAGHTVLVSNSRGPETLKDFAGETGATAVTTADAVRGVDVIITSIPFGKMPDLKGIFASVAGDVVVIDTSKLPHSHFERRAASSAVAPLVLVRPLRLPLNGNPL